MVTVQKPVSVPAEGGKRIDEYFGRGSSGTAEVSIARMVAPPGWTEPPQQPEFNEYTVVLSGTLMVEVDGKTIPVGAGEAILIPAGKRVRYSAPEGAEYVAVCVPAFAPELAHREE